MSSEQDTPVLKEEGKSQSENASSPDQDAMSPEDIANIDALL